MPIQNVLNQFVVLICGPAGWVQFEDGLAFHRALAQDGGAMDRREQQGSESLLQIL